MDDNKPRIGSFTTATILGLAAAALDDVPDRLSRFRAPEQDAETLPDAAHPIVAYSRRERLEVPLHLDAHGRLNLAAAADWPTTPTPGDLCDRQRAACVDACIDRHGTCEPSLPDGDEACIECYGACEDSYAACRRRHPRAVGGVA